jgi:hypothetical protein
MDRRRRRGERRGEAFAAQQAGEEKCRDGVAAAGRVEFEARRPRHPGAIRPRCQHRDLAGCRFEAGDEDDLRAAPAQFRGGLRRSGEVYDRPAGEPPQFEAVRSCDVGQRHGPIAVELADGRADVPAGAVITHDRVAAPQSPRVGGLHPADDVEQRRAGFGRAEIAR